jgi:ATP-binding cassette subfamily C protein
MPVPQHISQLAAFSGFYLRHAGRRFYVLTLLELANNSLQGLGLVFILPLLTLAGYLEGGSFGGVAAWILRGLSRACPHVTLWGILAFFVILNAAVALSTYFQTLGTTALQQSFLQRVRSDLYARILRTEWKFLSSQRQGAMAYNATTDIQQVYLAGVQLLNVAREGLSVAVGVAVCALLSPRLTLLASATGLLFIGVQLAFTRRTYRNAAENREAYRILFGAIVEGLASLKLIKGHAVEERAAAAFDRTSGEYSARIVERQKLVSLQNLFQTLLLTLLIAAYTFFAFRYLDVGGALFALFVVVLLRITSSVKLLLSQGDILLKTLPSFYAYRAQLAELEAQAEYTCGAAAPEKVPLRKALAFSGVSFSYSGRAEGAAVRDVSFSIRAHKTTALTGTSGAGKTTVVDLALGLLVPDSGTVTLDGAPLDGELRRRWRASLAYVPQDPFLYHDSIRRNLLEFAPGATEEAMWEALAAAQAEGFVRRLPQGLDTVVGDRGSNLSGGERQRIALARALLLKTEVLILDEATSALDAETERAIQSALESLQGKMTILIIAHRPSTIEKADVTIRMEEGQVAEVTERR